VAKITIFLAHAQCMFLSIYLKRILDLSRRCPFHRGLSRTWRRFMHISLWLWDLPLRILE
jgi:hypothetical protein